MNQQEMAFSSSTLLWLGLGTLAGVGVWLYFLKKKYPKMTIGEILSMIFVRENETVFIVATILINFAEALMAASIHPVGQTPPNPLARFLVHSIISFVAISAGITLIRDVAKIFVKGIGKAQVTARIIKVLLVLMAALGIPILNMYIIANGLKESIPVELFLASVNPFVSKAELAGAVLYYSLPPNYSFWGGLSYIMCATVSVTGVHMLLVLIEGFNNMDTTNQLRYDRMFEGVEGEKAKDGKDGKKEGEKGDKKGEKKEEPLMDGEERHISQIKDNLLFLLRRVNYTGSGLDNLKTTTAGKLDKMPLADQAKMAERIAKLVNEGKTIDSKAYKNDEDKKREKKDLDLKIRALFEGSPKETDIDKRGFGTTLKK